MSLLSKFANVEFCAEFGPHFTINRMLTFDFGEAAALDREGSPHLLEFNYMLMQAVDFLSSPPQRLRLQMGRIGPVGPTSSTAWTCRRGQEAVRTR